MNNELENLLADLQNFELPRLRKDSFKIGAALLSDLPVEITRSSNVYRMLDCYVSEMFAERFGWAMTFQWAGGPGDGRRIHIMPDDAEFESIEEYYKADQEYWDHFGEPEPWQELALPIRDPGNHQGPRERRPESVQAFLLERVCWTISNKLYRIRDSDDESAFVAYSTDPREKKMIEAQEAEHQQQRAQLIDLFVEQIREPFRFFHTNHVLHEQCAEDRGWFAGRDEIFAIIDPIHLRVLWTQHDRWYC